MAGWIRLESFSKPVNEAWFRPKMKARRKRSESRARCRCRHRAGFSLLELLVVIAIIGILAALLLPALSAAKLKARQIQCLGSIKQLTTSALMYSGDNARASGYNAPAYPNGHWMGVLLDDYGKQKNVLLCPCAPVRNPPAANPGYSQGSADRAWVRWTSDGMNMFGGSYAYNGWLYSDLIFPDPGDTRQHLIFTREAAIQKPALTPVFVDANWVDLWPLEVDRPWPDLYNGLPMGNREDQIGRCLIARHGGRSPSSVPRNFPAGRRLPGAINVGSVDGHCESVKLDKLWGYYWHLDWDPSAVTHGGAP